MSPVIVTAAALVFLFLVYRFYGRMLAADVFELDRNEPTPAVTRNDGYDFVPTGAPVLFGHHFASIAGLGPIVGPAVAVIWGWLPAFLWIVFGAAFVGAVHDFSTLVLSIRHGGGSIGDVTRVVVNSRARYAFLAVIFFMLALSMGVFVHVIALLFSAPPGGTRFYPEAALPSLALIVIAMLSGWLVRVKNAPLRPVTAAGVTLMLLSIYLGMVLPAPQMTADSWKTPLLFYAFVASVLPVWLLLQPRDYINAFELYLGGFLLYLGFFAGAPSFKAPALNAPVPGLPSLFPFLFITLACGACSGFHSLVSSGTTSKQLADERHALPIGFGSMLAEAALALIVLMACACGAASPEAWHAHYSSFSAASGLGPKLTAFIDGGSVFISTLGIPVDLAAGFIAVVIVSFALTTLDSATRLLSYVIEELLQAVGVPALPASRLFSSLGAVLAIAYFAFIDIDGKPAGLVLWQLFGVTNQLLAGLGLLVATVYLARHGRNTLFTLVPMLFMFTVSIWAILRKLAGFAAAGGSGHLLFTGSLITLLASWLIIEAVVVLFSLRGHGSPALPDGGRRAQPQQSSPGKNVR